MRVLWWAVLAEFLLARLLSRVGVYIPKSGAALAIYDGALLLGQIAFTFSLLLGVVLLLRRDALGALAVAALVLLTPRPAPPVWWSLAVALVLAGAVAALGARAIRKAWAEPGLRGALALVLAVHLLTYLANAGQLAWAALALPGAAPLAAQALRFGELLALLAPVALLWPPGRLRPAEAGAGLGAVAALGAGYLANADLTAIMAMYSLGFSLSWPPVLYLLALGAGIPALLALVRRDSRRGHALGLLFLAGYALTVNLQHIVVLVAWVELARPAALTEVAV